MGGSVDCKEYVSDYESCPKATKIHFGYMHVYAESWWDLESFLRNSQKKVYNAFFFFFEHESFFWIQLRYTGHDLHRILNNPKPW